MFKYSMTKSTSMKLLRGKHELADVIKVCSVECLTTQIELVLPAFFQSLDSSQNCRIFNGRPRAIVWPLKYLSQYNSLLFDQPCI